MRSLLQITALITALAWHVAASDAQQKLIPAVWQNNSWNVSAGFPGVIFCDFRLDPATHSNLTIELELPDGVRCIGASPWRNRLDAKGQAALFSDKIEKLDNGRWRITPTAQFSASLNPKHLAWNNYYRLFLDADVKNSGGPAICHLTADGREIASAYKFRINVMPPLPEKRQKIKNFGLLISYIYSLNAPDKAIRDQALRYWTALAERPQTMPVFQFDILPDNLRKRVLKELAPLIFVGTRYSTPLGNLAQWQAKQQLQLPTIIQQNGKPLEWLCPSYLANNPDSPVWQSYLPEIISKKQTGLPPGTPIAWDIEPGANNYCYCDTCRKNFSSAAKISTIPSADAIRRNHAAAWFQFRVRQNGAIIKNFANSVRRHSPRNPLFLVTDPLMTTPPYIQEWCGVDIRMCDKGEFDLFMNMPYYQGVKWFDNLAFNCEKTQTPQYPLIDPSENMEMFYRRYTPRGVAMNMIAAAALGARGIGFWPGDNFDAAYLHAIADTAELIARGEFAWRGKKSDKELRFEVLNISHIELSDGNRTRSVAVPDFAATTRTRLLESDGEYLLCVFNYNRDKELLFRAALPKLPGQYHIIQLNDNAKLAGANHRDGFIAEVPPESVRIFAITARDFSAERAISSEATKIKLANFLQKERKQKQLKSVGNDKSSVTWALLPGGSTPLLKLSSEYHSIYIDPGKNGAVISWQLDPYLDIAVNKSDRGVFDELHLNAIAESLVFEPVKLGIADDNSPYALLRCTVPPPANADPDPTLPVGLVIEKRILLSPDGKRIYSTYTMRNPADSGRVMNTAFRLRNHPRLGADKARGKPLSSMWTLEIPATPANAIFPGKYGIETLVLKQSQTAAGKMAGQIAPERYSAGAAILRSTKSGMISFELKPAANTAGFMSWWSASSASTVEHLSVNKLLKPGETWTTSSEMIYSK